MRVKFTRPHQGGSMSGIGTDIMVEDLPDGTPLPAGATMVDATTPLQEWTREGKPRWAGRKKPKLADVAPTKATTAPSPATPASTVPTPPAATPPVGTPA